MVKMLAVVIGSSLPAYLAWEATGDQSVMVRFWAALIAWGLGWYLSRRFARTHLDF